MISGARSEVILPRINSIILALKDLSIRHASQPMMAREFTSLLAMQPHSRFISELQVLTASLRLPPHSARKCQCLPTGCSAQPPPSRCPIILHISAIFPFFLSTSLAPGRQHSRQNEWRHWQLQCPRRCCPSRRLARVVPFGHRRQRPHVPRLWPMSSAALSHP